MPGRTPCHRDVAEAAVNELECEMESRAGYRDALHFDGDTVETLAYERDVENTCRHRRGSRGGRLPLRFAPAIGATSSALPSRAARSMRPPRLMSPRPTKSIG